MDEESLWQLVSRTVGQSNSLEKAVFFLLAALSLVSWCILLLKLFDLLKAKHNSAKFLHLFKSADRFGTVQTEEYNLGQSPLLAIFKSAMQTMEGLRHTPRNGPNIADPRQIPLRPATTPEDFVLLNMHHTAKVEYGRLQRGLSFLATIGSTSPFIGLFGTVWGIMNTFREIGTEKNVSLAVVAPGMSAALIATAAGLAVAIPAVMAYNWFLSQIDEMQDHGDSFIERMHILVKSSGFLGTPAPDQPTQAYSRPALPRVNPPVAAPLAAPITPIAHAGTLEPTPPLANLGAPHA